MKEESIEGGGDDFGTIWYTFKGMTLPQVVDWIRRRGFSGYEVSDIMTKKKFGWFGPVISYFVTFDRSLGKNPMQSEFLDMMKWLLKHHPYSRLEFRPAFGDAIEVTFVEEGDDFRVTTNFRFVPALLEPLGPDSWQEVRCAIITEHEKNEQSRYSRGSSHIGVNSAGE